MEFKKNLVSLVAFVALAVLSLSVVSAYVNIDAVEVNGVQTPYWNTMAVEAGQTVPVRVVFTSNSNLSDVRVKAWITGDRELSVSSERFDVLQYRTYTKLLVLQVPTNIDPSEELNLIVLVEDRANGVLDAEEIPLTVQRESYKVEILDVIVDPKVKAGTNVPIDLILKNRGSHFAEDTFVRATIAQLGIEKRAYFGDLSPVDQANPDKEDAAERRMYLSIPSNTPAGIYTVQFEVYNDDSSSTVTKKIAVVGSGSDSRVVSSTATKTFAVGEQASYAVTLVNSGSSIRVYELSFETPEGLTVTADDNSIIVVSAGESKTVKVNAVAEKAGKYTFVVNVESDGELVKKESFTAQVNSKGIRNADATVVLTVVLAIIFVVLLVVLIVLLTRKPQKSEELGESYY